MKVVTYSSKGQLNVHIRKVHKGIKYNCELCEYKTTQKAHLKAHINGVHENIRSFKCSSCGYMSRTKHTLAIHMAVHKLKSHVREIHQLTKTDVKNVTNLSKEKITSDYI